MSPCFFFFFLTGGVDFYVARPPHLGTSIGVTRSLAEVLTKPFTVLYVSPFF